MKKSVIVVSLIVVSIILMSGTIDLNNLFNYANQTVPSYITHDNIPASNQITDEGATLGRVLFYDKKLSTSNTISCGSCHQQQFAFSDTAQFSVGVNNITHRHSMRLVNIRYGEDSLFRWDRSATTLEEQMTIPIEKLDEMGYSGTGGAPDFNDLINKLDTVSYYDPLFTAAFGDATITKTRIQKALSQFVRSIQSFDSKYDAGRALVNSDTVDFPNFTTNENLGKRLFIDSFSVVTDTITVLDAITQQMEDHPASRRISGGFNCASCHRPPEFDIDPNTLNNGFIRGNPAFGPGNDYTVTRTPTLRDMADPNGILNGGMFHFGQATNINLIFAHYDFRQIDPNNNDFDQRYLANGLPVWLDITMQERQQINAFLLTLTGNDVYTNPKWSDPFDANGNLTVMGGTTSVNELNVEKNHFQIYPNPVSNRFTIKGDSDSHKIELINSAGKILRSTTANGNSYSVDISTFPSGIYFVRIKNSSDKLIEVQRIIKE